LERFSRNWHSHTQQRNKSKESKKNAQTQKFGENGRPATKVLTTPGGLLMFSRRTIPRDQQIKFIKSVDCLMKAPAKYKKHFPIVEDRYDDFVALHVNATKGGEIGSAMIVNASSMLPTGEDFHLPTGPEGLNRPPITAKGIHGTGSFMHWHRYVLNIWEDTLINECGWEGGMPCEPKVVITKSATDMNRLELASGHA
jgi:hypothetical protein